MEPTVRDGYLVLHHYSHNCITNTLSKSTWSNYQQCKCFHSNPSAQPKQTHMMSFNVPYLVMLITSETNLMSITFFFFSFFKKKGGSSYKNDLFPALLLPVLLMHDHCG